MTLSRAQLDARLDARLADPSLAAEEDKAIWEACGAVRGILVIDLSGFTALTRERGILHFLTVHRRASHVVRTALCQPRARLVKSDADNFLATFATAADTLTAALAIREATRALDATLDEYDRIHTCMGVGFGQILELTDDVFGDEVNVTFKLGEDVACSREILITESARTTLAGEGVSPKVERRNAVLGGVDVTYFALA